MVLYYPVERRLVNSWKTNEGWKERKKKKTAKRNERTWYSGAELNKTPLRKADRVKDEPTQEIDQTAAQRGEKVRTHSVERRKKGTECYAR